MIHGLRISWNSPSRTICIISLRWRHNERDSVSNHQPHDCLLNRLFRRRPKKTSKLRITGHCEGNSQGTGEFPAQMASYAENASIWWRHHVITYCYFKRVGICSSKQICRVTHLRDGIVLCSWSRWTSIKNTIIYIGYAHFTIFFILIVNYIGPSKQIQSFISLCFVTILLSVQNRLMWHICQFTSHIMPDRMYLCNDFRTCREWRSLPRLCYFQYTAYRIKYEYRLAVVCLILFMYCQLMEIHLSYLLTMSCKARSIKLVQ